MSNLFRKNWTKNELTHLFQSHPPRPLIPSLDSAAWREVAANPVARSLTRPLIRLAKAEWNRPLPKLHDSLYAIFQRTGKRLKFEHVYFERRRRFARAAIALLLAPADDPWRERLIRSVTAKLQDIFEEDSWALPAHVTKKSGKDRRVIDLFCAETSNLMAESLDLFSAVLPAGLCRRIRTRLRRDVWEPLRQKPQEYGWCREHNNWNAVCHQGVLGSALSQETDPERLAELMMEARDGLPYFLRGFEKDGGTSEGPGYWDYGFGWFTVLNEQLETRTDGALTLFDNGHVRRIAEFGPLTSLRDGKLVNFADCAAESILRPSTLAYLGERLKLDSCRALARTNYSRFLRKGIELDAERADLFCLVRLLLHCPRKIKKVEAIAGDGFLPKLGVIVARGKDRRNHFWEFAAKAGHNGEHHNHNDCGGWLLNIDGTRYVAEIGAPEYVKNFFGPRRYEFLAARSLSHSVPVINGYEQGAGPQYTSRVRHHYLSENEVRFEVDATGSYPREAGCREFRREFYFDKRNGKLRVEDRIRTAGDHHVEGALISIFPMRIMESRAQIQTKTGVLIIRPLAGTKLVRVETHPYRTHEGDDAQIYRLVYGPQKAQPEVNMGLELRLR